MRTFTEDALAAVRMGGALRRRGDGANRARKKAHCDAAVMEQTGRARRRTELHNAPHITPVIRYFINKESIWADYLELTE